MQVEVPPAELELELSKGHVMHVRRTDLKVPKFQYLSDVAQNFAEISVKLNRKGKRANEFHC